MAAEENSSTHYAHGGIKPGAVLNPSGKNGLVQGFQPYGKRSAYWLAKLSNQELFDLYTNKEAFGKLSSYDSMIITHLVDAHISESRGAERERLLSRIEGQPKSSMDLNVDGEVKVKHGLDDSARRFIESKLAGIAARNGAQEDTGRVIEGTATESAVRLEILGETEATSSEG